MARFIIRLFILTLILLSPGVFAADVTGVRLWKAPDSTRVVFDLDGNVSHTLFTLSDPYRIVIDLKNSEFRASMAMLDLSSSDITGLRTGRKGNDTRVVLDLKRGMHPKSFVLKPNEQYGYRLVIDLTEAAKTSQSKQTVKAPETPRVSKTHNNSDGKRNLIIAIDPGHGGEDPGATGRKKTHEKDIVLAIAKELKILLDKEPGYKPFLTRTGDYYIPLKGRRDIARRKHADLFISIHADAFTNTRAKGASVFALSERGATSATARYLADQENSTDIIGGVGGVSLEDKDETLRSVLVDLSMTAQMSSSLSLGRHILGYLDQFAHLHKASVEQAGFAVLKSPDIPSVLVETGFISNPGEEKQLNSASYRKRIATAMFMGVTRYFSENPEPGTYVAWLRNHSGETRNYVVSRGDTLSEIAARNGISLSELKSLNNLSSQNIRVGQVLRLPDV